MNKSILMLGTLCAGFASASGYLWQEMRAQRERAESLQTQIAELRSAQRAQPSRTYTPPAPVAEVSGATMASVSDVPVAAASVRTTPNSASPPAVNASPQFRAFNGFDQQRRLLKDPEYRKLVISQQRSSMRRMHPDLTSALDISREQTDRLYDLLAEHQVRMMEDRAPMQFTNGQPDQAALQEMHRRALQEQQNTDKELAALLGDAKLAEWKDYEESMGARLQVNQLRDTLAGSDSALRQDQLKSLIAAIAQEQGRAVTDGGYNSLQPMPGPMTPENRTRMMEESVERTRASNQRIHDAASAILSSEQLESLDEMLNQNLDAQRMGVRMMRARAEAEERGELPAETSMSFSSSESIAVGP